ncbi:MAG TPA: hypothetical protein VLH15_00930 [Dehalococcoidales bacterium]|nr:hypothetical protein [Dehalococcoidales bacterium]
MKTLKQQIFGLPAQTAFGQLSSPLEEDEMKKKPFRKTIEVGLKVAFLPGWSEHTTLPYWEPIWR